MRMLLFLWGLVGASFCLFDGGATAVPAKMQVPVEMGFEGSGTRRQAGMGFEEAVVLLSGASCIEDLSEEEMLRWEALASHPVNLNIAGRSRLISSGLFTQFQVASLLDYRGRTGAVLSWSELALVDGFSPEFVSALRVFATLGVEVAGGSGKGTGGPGSGTGSGAGSGMGSGLSGGISGPGGAFVPGQRESLKLGGSVTVKGAGRISFANAQEGASGDGSSGGHSRALLSSENPSRTTQAISAGGSPGTFSPAILAGG